MQQSADVPGAVALLSAIADGDPAVDLDGLRVTIPIQGGVRRLSDAVRELDGAGIEVSDIALRRPTLDEVFLSLTGHAEAVTGDQEPGIARVRSHA